MTVPVSVLVPVHNGEVYCRAALESVLNQTFRDFELIVVDDGSTDSSREIAAELAARDPRLRSIHKPKSGLSDTLNVGLRAARGDWVARLDADDLMAPNRLERQLAFVEADRELAAAGSYYHVVDGRGRIRATRFPLPRTRRELARYLDRREVLTFTHPTMIYRRELALTLGGYRAELEPCEDADLFARMLATGAAILIQPEVLTLYRVHPASISTRRAREMGLKARYVFHNFYGARAGLPALTYPEFRAALRAQPPARRMRLWAELASERLLNAHTVALVAGHPLRALLLLAGASALKPMKALRRGLRTVGIRTAGETAAA